MSLLNGFRIHSGPIPSVTITVQPGSSVVSEPGAFLSGSPLLQYETDFSGSDRRGLFSYIFSGESMFENIYTNVSEEPADVTFTCGDTGFLLPISKDQLSKGVFCVSGAFLAATKPIDVGFQKVRSFVSSKLSGESMWMQHCQSISEDDEAVAFLEAISRPIELDLKEEEWCIVDRSSVFAMTNDVQIKLLKKQGLKNSFGSGEGKFLNVLQGPGKAWVVPQGSDETGFFDIASMRFG